MDNLPSLDDPKKIPFNPNLPTALYVMRDEGGCGYYRCHQPAIALRRRGLFNTIVDFKKTTPEHIMQADIIIFQEVGSLDAIEAMEFAVGQGKACIVESDDFLHVVSPNNPGYASWNPGTLFLYRATMQMHRANAITVTTNQLAREYFSYNKNVYVLPNFLSEDKWDLPLVKKTDGIIRIGWAGGNAHVDDLALVAPVIEKLVKEYPGKIKFETMGLTKEELGSTFASLEPFHEKCPKCDYQGESMTWGGETLDNYPAVLASHGFDIGIVPVIDTAFNNAKSDLKIKEYAAAGIPIVASSVTPYREAQKNGANVILAETFKEWYNAIKKLIDDPELRNKIVAENKKWVSQYWVDDNIDKYAKVYLEVIEASKQQVN